MKVKNYTLPDPKKYQQDAIFSDKRYSFIEGSTKSGKSSACLLWLLSQAIKGVNFVQDGVTKTALEYWWIAPVFAQSAIMYERLKRVLNKSGAKVLQNETDMTISIPVIDGRRMAIIRFKSGDKYDTLYGAEVGAVVIDEASRTREEVLFAARSIVTTTQGPIRAIGNVKGRRNWFYQQCRLAESGRENYIYARFTSDDAIREGIVKQTEIDDAKLMLPEAIFRELYYAEASDDGGNPFGIQNIAACVVPYLSLKPPRCFGVDFGKYDDYTVIVGLDDAGSVCRFDRFRGLLWPDTIARVKATCGHHKTLLDASGLGDPIVDQLQKDMGTCYEGFKFSWHSKQELMTRLAVAIQGRKIHFPDGVIRQELDSFEYEIKVNDGRVTSVRYSAPAKQHDDCVCALALAVAKLPNSMTVWDRLGTPKEIIDYASIRKTGSFGGLMQ